MKMSILSRAIGTIAIGGFAALGFAGGHVSVTQGAVKTVTGHALPTVKAAFFDARSLPVQINNHFLMQGELEHDNPIPPLKWNLDHGSASPVPVGGAVLPPNSNMKYRFPGIGATGWVPPDVNIGVGTNFVSETVNSTVAFFNKSTGAMVFSQDFQTFFQAAGWQSNFLFDPKTMFDPVSQRFFVLADEGAGGNNISAIDIAVSQTSDPTQGWYEYRVNALQTISGNKYWLDYPSLACTPSGVVVTGNMFPISSGGFGGIQFIVLPKIPMISGLPISPYTLQDSSLGSAQMARNSEASQRDIYGMALSSNSTMRIYQVVNPTLNPVLKMVDVAIPSFQGANSATSIDNTTLDTLGDRILNCYERNGHLMAGHSVNSNVTNTSNARWYQFNINGWPNSGQLPTLRQSGQIATGPIDDDFQPAVNENANGDMSIIYSRSNANVQADILLSTRLSTDPLGQTSKPVLLQQSAGVAPYTSYRWGDFFEVALDPVDSTTFWGGEEVVDANGNWQTYFFSWQTGLDVGGVVYNPNSYTVLQGNQLGGTLASFDAVDGDTFNIAAAVQKPYGSVTSVETVTNGVPTPTRFLSATYDVNPIPGITVFLYAKNKNTGQFDLISTKATVSTGPIKVDIPNYLNYVDNGTVTLILRETLPKRTGLNTIFISKTDQLIISAK